METGNMTIVLLVALGVAALFALRLVVALFLPDTHPLNRLLDGVTGPSGPGDGDCGWFDGDCDGGDGGD